jgi:seryl-tRNA synthetase
MIDIKQIEKYQESYKDACKAKGFAVDIDHLLTVYADIQENKKQLQEITTKKNKIGKSIPKLSGDEKKNAIGKLSLLKKNEARFQDEIKRLQPEFDDLMLQVPQLPDDDVKVGKDDTENVEIRREGEVRQFDFEPKDHVQLGLALGIIDIERGVKLAGTRNYFLKGDGALLHWAVLQFAMDFMVGKGYVPLSVPLLARDEVMEGTGWFPGAEDQTYRTKADESDFEKKDEVATSSTSQTYLIEEGQPFFKKDEAILHESTAKSLFDDLLGMINFVGTAEVPLTAYHMGEILKEEELPKKYVAMSSCFRREAGAAGKDTYGLYRIHQFDKIEQVIICKNDIEESNKFHEEILANAEAVMRALELPYRVANVCTGDLGRGQAKKFDIETWMPSRNNYCETHSASKFYEFQARRMNLRYKPGSRGTGHGTRFCHTLNNTVIASPRILIPILELYQNADGSVTIPKVLRPYMGNREKIVKRER